MIRPLLEYCRTSADRFPCLWMTVALLNAGLLPMLRPEAPASLCFLAVLPLTLPAWALLGSARCLRVWILPSALLALSFLLHGFGESALPDRPVGAEVRAVMKDPSLCAGTPDWIPSAPNNALAEVEAFRYTSADCWKDARGERVFVRFSPQSGLTPGYGDELLLRGALEPVRNSECPGAFDFAAYAAGKGVGRIFTVRDGELLRRGDSFLRRLCNLRGRVLEALGRNLNADSRAIASALLFGMKQGIDSEIRSDFLRSGTIHVLCVSGLHIGLFASVLLLILRPLPFAVRWLAVPLPVLLYALSTGMQGPAFRAFVMFAVWALLKAFHCRTDPLNTIALAAVLLIVWNPLAPRELGFQYSFLCVFFLLLCREFLQGIQRASGSVWKYRFAEPGILRRWAGGMLIFSFGASVAAYLASFGVSMLHQGLFSPYAVPAYLLMSPAAWICFAVFVCGLLVGWIPGALEVCGVVMGPLLSLMRKISAFFAEEGAYYTAPSPWWCVGAFLLLLALLFGCRKRRWKIAAAVLLALCFAGLLLIPRFRSPELLIRHGGGVRPMLVFAHPGLGRAFVFNVPDYEGARDAAAWLRSEGVGAVEELFCDSARRESCGGAASFLKMIRVRNLTFASPVRVNALSARKARKTAAEQGLPVEDHPVLPVGIRKSGTETQYTLPHPWNGLVLRFRKMRGGEELELSRAGGKAESFFLPLERDFRWREIPLEER